MEGIISAPVLGEVKDITTCCDSVFAEKMLGDGVLIIPSDGVIVSPCNGKIYSIMKSKHAITFISDDGLELLVHIGIDTVELEGEGFESFVKDGQSVKKGQKLIHVDFNLIKEHGYDSSVLLVVLSKNYEVKKQNLDLKLSQYEDVLICKKEII